MVITVCWQQTLVQPPEPAQTTPDCSPLPTRGSQGGKKFPLESKAFVGVNEGSHQKVLDKRVHLSTEMNLLKNND